MTTLDVPGATLTYDVTGSGPVLLLVPGGAADSTMFAPIRPLLAEDHTVVTYDPRGISRSPLHGEPGPDTIREHADDVDRLLTEVGPADVFASSGGAITLLEHVVRHAGRVRTVVLHEPPVTRYLGPDVLAGPDIPAIYREHGIGAAIAAFMEMSGFDIAPPADPTPEEFAQMRVMEGNFAYFFGHLMAAIGAYEPDLDALRATSARLVVGVGEKSAGLPAHEAGLGLAADLGLTAEPFPGDHGGFEAEPAAFAARLRAVLEGC
ncbi:pimeloyl-ACP methyl ester carboxylesterase [Amycolatopsis lexingtonensis]|uniref:Pimeloyl-ACP methyl ester carboxylesterase n=1 Tax=Amycolatopsis lexingtonensis TaxID=218822 RepID=A0ABR9HV82_9PSEU|nr:alpha/beta hydrolase [Amycolatopsis lexingtonensis]MBE1494820.1 pimeloyl-ACP methyl ester carboxylesterase [Amycolatopsis lexingtonensis]